MFVKKLTKIDTGLIAALLGTIIGFRNILSFSAQCYKNGGGAFVFLFILALLLVETPMLLLGSVIGSKTKLPIVSALGLFLGKIGKCFGWIMIATIATIGGFYFVLSSYSLCYALFFATGSIPSDTHFFFKHTFLQDSGSLLQFEGFSPIVIFTALACLLFSWFILVKGIREKIEKVCSIFLPFITILIILFSLLVCFLPGAKDGLRLYLIPDFSKLKDPMIWRDVFGFVFFSCFLRRGIISLFASKGAQSISPYKLFKYLIIGDFVITFFSGIAIFGALGYMSHIKEVPFAELVTLHSNFEMGFVIFPQILQILPSFLTTFLGIIFFLALFFAGISSCFSLSELFATNLEAEFGFTKRKSLMFSSLIMLVATSIFSLKNGQHLLGSLGPSLFGSNMLLEGFVEIIAFMYFAEEIFGDGMWRNQTRPTLLYHLAKKIVPTAFFIILCICVYEEFSSLFGPEELTRWIWFALVFVFAAALSQKKTAISMAVDN